MPDQLVEAPTSELDINVCSAWEWELVGDLDRETSRLVVEHVETHPPLVPVLWVTCERLGFVDVGGWCALRRLRGDLGAGVILVICHPSPALTLLIDVLGMP